ncbi:MAG: hypothetical protein P8X57_00005, partial [Cyclobacteriaceae bacterium]
MKKLSILFFICLLPLSVINAQGSRQALLADSLYRYSSYAKAVKHFKKAIRKEDDPALIIGLANSHFKLQEYDQAISNYADAEKFEGAWTVQDKLNYIESVRIKGDDMEVDRLLKKWNSIPGSRENVYETSLRAMDIFFMDSSIYQVEESEMNTEFAEFSPSYYKDGVLFASSRSKGNVSGRKYHWNQENYLDLYYSGDGNISPVGINTKFHDGPVAFYDEGKRVIFTRNEDVSKRKDQRQLALFEADVTSGGKWENIKPLSLNDAAYSVSHPALSSDGNTLYFVSNMPGGFGGTDIYRSSRNADGWSEPVNLGEDINTEGNEMFPNLYGEELFFASDGHPGLGGLDNFIAEQLSEGSYYVRNAGYPLNTTWDDFGLVTRDGMSGYLSSNRNGNDDIFTFVKDKIILELTYIDEEQNILDSVATLFQGRTYTQGGDHITTLYLDRNALHEIEGVRHAFADTIFSVKTNDEFFLSRTVPLKPLEEVEKIHGIVDLYPIAFNDTDYDLFLGKEKTLMKVDKNDNWKDHFELKNNLDIEPEDKLIRIKKMLEKNGYTVRIH